MVCGYPTGNGRVVWSDSFRSNCVFPGWVGSSMDFNLARTSLCFKEGLFLYAITGGSGKIWFSVLLFWINFQCFLSICLSLWASSQNCVTETNLLYLGFSLNRIWLNLTEFICGKTCLYF